MPVAVIVEGAGDTVTVRELQSRTNTEGLTVGDAATVIQSLTAGRAL